MTDHARDFAARFKRRRHELGLSLEDIAREIGIAWQSVNGWEKGSMPRPQRYEAVARAMRMSVEELFYGSPARGTGATTQSTVMTSIQPVPIIGLRDRVPVIPWSLAGNWKQAHKDFHPGDAEAWLFVTRRVGDMAFAVKATGDAMASATDRRNLPDGAYVVIDPAVAPEHDKIVLARRADGHALLRLYWLDGNTPMLRPLNDRYPITDFPEGSEIVGVAVQAIKDL